MDKGCASSPTPVRDMACGETEGSYSLQMAKPMVRTKGMLPIQVRARHWGRFHWGRFCLSV